MREQTLSKEDFKKKVFTMKTQQEVWCWAGSCSFHTLEKYLQYMCEEKVPLSEDFTTIGGVLSEVAHWADQWGTDYRDAIEYMFESYLNNWYDEVGSFNPIVDANYYKQPLKTIKL